MKNLKQMAEELGRAITESNEYKEYAIAKDKYDNDASLQDLIKEFNLKKMSVMQEMKSKDKDEDRLTKYQDEMRNAYSGVISNPVMIEYSESKDKLQNIVNEVYETINFCVTGEEPGCNGSCSDCSGCH